MSASGLTSEVHPLPASASRLTSEVHPLAALLPPCPASQVVAAPPAEESAFAASVERGRSMRRSRVERSDQRAKVEAGEGAEPESPPGSDESRGRRSTTSAAQGRNFIKHFKFALSDRTELKCKFCNSGCNDASVTAVYDQPQYEGKTPWRSYKAFRTEENPDGSLTVYKRPEGKVCSLCRSVYTELGWGDSYGTIDSYAKNHRTEELHSRFMVARKPSSRRVCNWRPLASLCMSRPLGWPSAQEWSAATRCARPAPGSRASLLRTIACIAQNVRLSWSSIGTTPWMASMIRLRS